MIWASWTGFIPRVSAHVAKLCRSRCGWAPFSRPASSPSSRMSWSIPDRVSGSWSPLRPRRRPRTPGPTSCPAGGRARRAAQPAAELGHHRHVPLPVALAPDPQVRPAVPLDQVAQAEARQLRHPQARVGQHPHDQLVPLRLRRVLQAADLLAAQHVQQAPRQLRRLGLHPLGDLTLAPCPRQERVDRPDVARDGELRQRAPSAALVQQPRRVAIQHPGRHLARLLDALLGTERQEHLVQRVAVRLAHRPDRQPRARHAAKCSSTSRSGALAAPSAR